jgi:hypothetical protein
MVNYWIVKKCADRIGLERTLPLRLNNKIANWTLFFDFISKNQKTKTNSKYFLVYQVKKGFFDPSKIPLAIRLMQHQGLGSIPATKNRG